ncbi:MAG: ABC transporter substrate-binding protein [Microbacterium sp.]
MELSTTRRRAAAGVATALGAMLALSACASSTPGNPDATPAAASGDAFPVTVETAYGDITLDEKPERIVALSVDFVDDLTSLGETPVAFSSDGFTARGADPDISLIPWMTDKVSIDLWDIDASSDNLEAIAAYDPDLVIAWENSIDENIYKRLSEFATVYIPDRVAGTDWKATTTEIGLLTGKSEEAKEQITAVEQTYAVAQEQLHGLQGKTYNVGTLIGGEVVLSPWTFLTDLGLVPAANHPTDDYPRLSMENVDQLQADVLMLVAFDEETTNTFKSDPRVASLPASQNGTLIYLPIDFYGAAGYAGPANMTWIADQLVSLLEDTPFNQTGQ